LYFQDKYIETFTEDISKIKATKLARKRELQLELETLDKELEGIPFKL
jgi:hypothetical protein